MSPLFFIVFVFVGVSWGEDPTDGFEELPLTGKILELHKPFDLPPCARYVFSNDTHKFWTLRTDKPAWNHPGNPRSEIRIRVNISSLSRRRISLHQSHARPILAFIFICIFIFPGVVSDDPTDGFTEQALNASSFVINKPYDLTVCARYLFLNKVVHVFSLVYTDNPPTKCSSSKPLTEIRIQGRTGMSVMSIIDPVTETYILMLKINNGSLCLHGDNAVLAENIYDNWVRLNVIHDPEAGEVQIFISGNLTRTVQRRSLHHVQNVFQFGVTMLGDSSIYMESRWQNIKILKS